MTELQRDSLRLIEEWFLRTTDVPSAPSPRAITEPRRTSGAIQ